MNLPAHICGDARPGFVWALIAATVLLAIVALPEAVSTYYAVRLIEALCVFAGIFGGAAIICMFAEEYARMRDGGDKS
jgi:hypothetical protein